MLQYSKTFWTIPTLGEQFGDWPFLDHHDRTPLYPRDTLNPTDEECYVNKVHECLNADTLNTFGIILYQDPIGCIKNVLGFNISSFEEL